VAKTNLLWEILHYLVDKMAKIVKLEVSDLPGLYVIGKKITVEMPNRPEKNPIPKFWETCFSDNTFGQLMDQRDILFNDAYVGWMTDFSIENGTFTYICGMLMNADRIIQGDVFVSRKIEPVKVGIGWLQGFSVPEVCFAAHGLMENALNEIGYTCENPSWCMELYNCPRFTKPDENGEIILDYYVPCTKKPGTIRRSLS